MKAIILAGGLGTRLEEETHLKPKPLIEVGGKPLLWHIMKSYSFHNINDFVVCLGYKGYLVKEYFSNYFLHTSDVTIDIKNNKTEIHQIGAEPWKITLIDTGENTMTGGRIKRVKKYVNDTFCLTYGDGLSDVNISESIKFHKNHNFVATVTAVQPPGRFGSLKIKEDMVTNFQEKPPGDSNWINGGYFVCEPEIIDYIEDDTTIFEGQPLQQLANFGKLGSFKHHGFWMPMDTLRDKRALNEMWDNDEALWKTWEK
jgi:glucose-1-phosphate cytidylyltransferase